MGTLKDEHQAAMQNCTNQWLIDRSEVTPDEFGEWGLIKREVHAQLWATMCTLMGKHYNLANRVCTVPQGEFGEEFTMVTLRCLGDVSCSEYRDIKADLDVFLEDLVTIADDGHIRVMASQGIGLALLEYDEGDLYDALMYMAAEFFSNDKDEMMHLNAIWHLEERLENFVPACNLS